MIITVEKKVFTHSKFLIIHEYSDSLNTVRCTYQGHDFSWNAILLGEKDTVLGISMIDR